MEGWNDGVTAFCLLPTPYCLLPTPYCLLHTGYFPPTAGYLSTGSAWSVNL
jgi:hypothetical protein